MLGKRYNWVPLLRARNVRMNRDPSTQKDGGKATPNNVPNRTTMRKVGAVVFRRRTVVNRRNGVRVNEGPLHQVVDKQEEQHYEGWRDRGQVSVGLMRYFIFRNVRGTKYTCGR